MVPFTICWVNGEIPKRLRTLARTAMIAAPITVPKTPPSPPNRLVPPMTTMVIASSSSPVPAVGSPTVRRETKISEVSAAKTPLMT